MPQTLKTSLSPDYPASMVRVAHNKLLIANGIDRMLKWDGTASSILTAGVDPPTTAITASTVAGGSLTISGGASYQVYVRFVDSDGNFSNVSPVSNSITSGTNVKLKYNNVPIPTDSKVVRRQILRNTLGQSSTYYVTLDTSDLTSTSFEDNVTDTVLSNNDPVTVTTTDGTTPDATRFTIPPNHKACLAVCLGRVFAAVERDFTAGHVAVVNGSNTVAGVGTAFTNTLLGRFLYVPGATPKEITFVNVATQSFVLDGNFDGATNEFAKYAVRSSPVEQRTVYWSEADYYEAWPATNAISISDTNSEITGLAPFESFLYVLERNRIHRFSFQDDPAEGRVYLNAYRGCINNRCWVVADDARIYMLDEQGIHALGTANASEPISEPIQDLFRLDAIDEKINWIGSQWFHASHDPPNSIIRWFVCLSNDWYPRHALTYNYRTQRWWIEEYPVAMCSSVDGFLISPTVIVGSEAKRVYGLGVGALDGVEDGVGIRGEVTYANPFTIEDSGVTFGDVVGSPVVITNGRAEGEQSVIAEVDGDELSLAWPLSVVPDPGDEYQIGGISWVWRSGWYRWLEQEWLTRREVAICWEPTAVAQEVLASIRYDYSKVGAAWSETRGEQETSGDTIRQWRIPMNATSGYHSERLDQGRARRTSGARYVQVQMKGYSGAETGRIYKVELIGAQG